MVYPSGGNIDGQLIPARTREECVAVLGLAIELNKGTDDVLADEQFFRELEAMCGPVNSPSTRPNAPVLQATALNQGPNHVADPVALKAALFNRLQEDRVVRLSVEYDGCGDSGCVEDVTAFGGSGEEMKLADDLLELVEEYVCTRLPDGWEINDGSFGEVEFDVQAGRVTFAHNQRITDSIYEQWEE